MHPHGVTGWEGGPLQLKHVVEAIGNTLLEAAISKVLGMKAVEEVKAE